MIGKDNPNDENRVYSGGLTGNNQAEDEEPEDEEALSLSDLPIKGENHQSRNEGAIPAKPAVDPPEEFNFCSWGDSLSKDSEMCVADEVFFQGQILPMRHSISFDGALITSSRTTRSRCISRSDSLDHSSHSSLGFTSLSSRSSSLNSYRSSSSGSSAAAATAIKNKPRPNKIHQNQFQFSHPSPKPSQIRSPNINNGGNFFTPVNRKSTFWSFLRDGLVTTPEISMQDYLKLRTKSGRKSIKTFGSRNSNSSINSTFSNNSSTVKADKKQTKQQPYKFFHKNSIFFSGCKCSSNAVVGPIPLKVPAVNRPVTRCSSLNAAHEREEEEVEDDDAPSLKRNNNIRATRHHEQQTGKQAWSRHRTFEWLKQLSLEAGVVIDETA